MPAYAPLLRRLLVAYLCVPLVETVQRRVHCIARRVAHPQEFPLDLGASVFCGAHQVLRLPLLLDEMESVVAAA